MARLPLRDRTGNVLLAVRSVAETELPRLVPLPAALVVAVHAGAVLMLFDRRRRQWELPGGMREAGETCREAAARELSEETGIHGVPLAFAAVAEFDLVAPARPSEEGLGFRWWWPLREPVAADMSPLDAELAARLT